MNITYHDKSTPFTYWTPALGRVYHSPFSFDCETTLIDETRPGKIPVYVLGAVVDDATGFFIDPEYVSSFLEHHDGVPIVMHNAAFDLRVLSKACSGLDIYSLVDRDLVYDTQLLYKLGTLATEGHTANGSSSLSKASSHLLGSVLAKDGIDSDGATVRLNFGRFLGQAFSTIPVEYLQYLGHDVLATHSLFKVLVDQITQTLQRNQAAFGYVDDQWLGEQVQQHGPLTHHIQLKASITLDQVMRNGMAIDRSHRDRVATHLDTEYETLKRQILSWGYLPGEKGCNKVLQRIWLTIESESPDVSFTRTAKGAISNRADALRESLCGHPFLRAYVRFKEVSKLRSTFLNKLDRDRVHPSFQTLARTGRTSSFGQINAQNLPRSGEIRECFVPSPGKVFIAADYAAVELATLAQVMLQQFRHPSHMAGAINAGLDLHRLVASRVLQKPIEEVTSDERQRAKPINFGKPGGMGDRSLKVYAKDSYGVDLSDSEVENLTATWFSLFPEMRCFLSERDNPGDLVAKLLGLTPIDFFQSTGDDSFMWASQNSVASDSPSPILGWMCAKTARDETPQSNSGTAYRPHQIDYFWDRLQKYSSRFGTKFEKDIRDRRASKALRYAVLNAADSKPCVTATGRIRAKTGYCARHNTLFQGLAADGAKLALWRLWREGFHVANFIHDEFLIEVDAESNLLQQAETIKRIMIDEMQRVVPDVKIDVEYAAMDRWSKSAQKIVVESKLVAWTPGVDIVDASAQLVSIGS